MRISLLLLSLPLFVSTKDKCNAGFEAETAENVNSLVDSAVGTVNGIPGVGMAVGAFMPIVKQMIKLNACEKKPMEFIKNEFQQIRTSLFEYTGRLEVAVKLDIVREIESNSRVLMHYLEKIADESTGHLTNKSISEFLQKCKELKPYDSIVKLKGQFAKVLPVQFENDVYHSKQNLNAMKRMLNSILIELTFVTLFQYNFDWNHSGDDRQSNINSLDKLILDTAALTKNKEQQLLDFNYWPGMIDFITKVMSKLTKSDNRAKAELIGKHLQEMHTNDRFCVVVHGSGDNAHKKYFYASDKENNLYFEEENNSHIHIIRSRTAHNLSDNEIVSNLRYNVGGFQIDDSACNWRESNQEQRTRDMLKKYGISAILVDTKLEDGVEFNCYGVPLYETTHTCTLANSNYFTTVKKLIVIPT